MLWRLVPAVRPGERERFLGLLGLYATIFAGLTVGLAGAEALLLARLGVQALPPTLVAASVATFLGSLAYAASVGRLRHDRLLVRLLLGVALSAGAAAPLAGAGPDRLLQGIYCLYALSFFLLVTHFWTYAAEAFDALSAKRLFPLLGVGASLGGVAGGAAAVVVRSPGLLLGLWAAAMAAATLLVRRLPGAETSPARRPLEEMAEGLRFVRGSPLARSFALAVTGMVVATSLLQYLYSDVFARAYPSPDRLAAFLGGFMAAANGVEMLLGLVVTPRLLARLGVPGATLVHPLATLASFGALAASYTVPMAALAWMDRKTLQGALAAPLRTLACNALPDRQRGRVRALLEGFVVYLAAALTAGALTALKGHLQPGPLCLAGAASSLVYLAGALGVRREYLKALADQLSQGRLDLAREAHGDPARLVALWADWSGSPHRLVSLAPLLARAEAWAPLLEGSRHPDPEVRRACVEVLGRRAPPEALGDPVAPVRLAALRALPAGAETLLADPDPEVRAEAASRSGAAGVLEEMARSADPATAARGLLRLPPDSPLLAGRLGDPSPEVRAAALGRLGADGGLEVLARGVDDPSPAVRRAAVEALGRVADPLAVPLLARALTDRTGAVHEAAVAGLSRRGRDAVPFVEPYLQSRCGAAAEGAMRALAALGARPLLAGEMRERVRQAWRDLASLPLVAGDDVPRRFLACALRDRAERERHLALYALELLEDAETVRAARRSVAVASARSRAGALELLSNLGDRRTAALLVLLLEEGDPQERLPAVRPLLPLPATVDEVLAEARGAANPWVRLGAAALRGEAAGRSVAMERLLLLESTPPLDRLTMEDQEGLAADLVEERFGAGEWLFRPGDPADRVYVVADGEVDLVAGDGTRLARCGPRTFVGELALAEGARESGARAVGPARALSFRPEALRREMSRVPEIGLAMLRLLTSRVRANDRRLVELHAARQG